MKVTRGTWNRTPDRYRFQWFRNETEIPGATRQTYRLGVADVGRRIKARVYVKKRGLRVGAGDRARRRQGRLPRRRRAARSPTASRRAVTSPPASASSPAWPPRRTPTRAAGATRASPSSGSRGASDFSLVLAEASWLPRFSSVCSVQWSCRAGRFVVINQTRWKFASPSWNGAGKSLRDYRHLVVNHETGHWLGHGHLGCPGPGRLAPVMMQQSKGLFGCRHNPWPLGSELWSALAARLRLVERRRPRGPGRRRARCRGTAEAEDVEDQVADVAVADRLARRRRSRRGAVPGSAYVGLRS